MKKKYQFKDKELKSTLDKISNGDFTKSFDIVVNGCTVDDDEWVQLDVCFGNETPSGDARFQISITRDDIEPYEGYQPDEWNDARYVVPPVGVWMMCEFDAADGTTHRYAAIYECDEFETEPSWSDTFGDAVRVDRFRPWLSEDEE